MKKLLVICALPYSNGYLHVGHIAGCYLPADIYRRYQKLIGRDVRFICGSDDHGVPIKLTADKEGKEPKEVAMFFNEQQAKDFKDLGINFEVYGSTCNSPYHYQTSQDFFIELNNKGYFEKKSSKQFYDEENKMFLPDRYVKGTCGYCGAKDQNSDQCEDCGKVLDVEHLSDAYSVLNNRPAATKETFHWYLDLTRFEDVVSKWLETAEVRDHTRNFVKGLISSGLVKRAMTRDIDWGVPVPLDDPDAKDKVLYVWFDAPIGYISDTKEACERLDGTPDTYADWWKSDDAEFMHFVGEDNTIFHCVIWIAMLSAEGSFKLPKGVSINQFLNIKFPGKNEEKISKSRGTAIWINEYIKAGNNPDSLRYYLTSIAPEKSRSVFNPEDMVQKHNSELANALGNFVNRVTSFYKKHFGETIEAINIEQLDEVDRKFEQSRQEIANTVGELINSHSFKAAQDETFEFIRSCNRYIDEKQPWSARKENPESAKATLTQCLNAIYTIATIISPFLPFTSEKIFSILGTDINANWQAAGEALEAGHTLGEPEILFEKIDPDNFL